MKSEIIIHIGLHRTGTTFLQKEVFEHLTYVNYIFDDALHRIEIKPGINLISNEGLSLSMPHSKTNRIQILDHLKRLFPDAKIIVGFRDKKVWLESCYNRYISSGGTLKYDDYLNKYKDNIIDFDLYLIEVKKRFKDVYTYEFIEVVLFPRILVYNICNFIGVDMPSFTIVKRNESLNKIQLKTIRILNIIGLKTVIVPIIKFIRKTPT